MYCQYIPSQFVSLLLQNFEVTSGKLLAVVSDWSGNHVYCLQSLQMMKP